MESTIDSFRDFQSRISDKQEEKDRLREIRRKGKNRNAAKKSRRVMLERMDKLRSDHKRLSENLGSIKYWERKIQVYEQKNYKYK